MQLQRSLPATRRLTFTIPILVIIMTIVAPAQTRSFLGRVVSVSDGDTVTVLDRAYQEHKIRLNGIDAPETSQDFGQVSRMHLARLLFGKDVLVITRKSERYERELAKIFVDQVDVNLAQVRAGLAWYYRAYESDVGESDRPALDQAEQEARAARRGLWQQRNPTPPWEYRAHKREENGNSMTSSPPSAMRIVGNRSSAIYHRSDCPDFDRVSEKNRIYFKTEKEAQLNGFRKARNCP